MGQATEANAGRRRLARRWLIGYVAALFASLPLALPCWNAGLRELVGRFVTIEQLHLLQYAGLGALAAVYACWATDHRGTARRVLLGTAVMGLLDELAQGWLPGREFQWSDVWLNWAGAGLGALAGWALTRMKHDVSGRRRVS